MKLSKHEEFLRELRAPVVAYGKARPLPPSRRTRSSPPTTSPTAENAQSCDEILSELEAKFNEMFGSADSQD